MHNNHERKIVPNILVGIGMVSAGIFFIIYDIKSKLPDLNKGIIGATIVVVINAGLYFWGNAFVHKIKSDIIRRQKIQEHRQPVQEL